MIITRTPVRISFFGGGTDYPAFYRRHGGATLTTAVDKYVYVTVHPLTEYFDHKIQVHYSKVETVKSLDEINIPIVRESLRMLRIHKGVEIHLVSDLPARTGLGSSSATTVGLLKALHGHLGSIVSNETLAMQAITVEQEMVGDRVGSQDQYACACGGVRHLQFFPNGKVEVEPVPIKKERIQELEKSLMLMYTGVQRTAHEILDEQLNQTTEGHLDECLLFMREQVAKGIALLTGTVPLSEFGALLHEAWELKRSLSSKISNTWLNDLYSKAREAGTIGGKLLGAGGGGFLLLFVEPDHQEQVRAALPGLREVPFRFESQGSQIIYYAP